MPRLDPVSELRTTGRVSARSVARSSTMEPPPSLLITARAGAPSPVPRPEYRELVIYKHDSDLYDTMIVHWPH